jgi:hypothetical protein
MGHLDWPGEPEQRLLALRGEPGYGGQRQIRVEPK